VGPNISKLIVGEIDPLNLWRFLSPRLVFPHTDWKIHPPRSAWIDAVENGGVLIYAQKGWKEA
jgi:hypothetical protein